eukprot:scaffold327197_cov77-Tisochrysis_lutea.AAC.1
MQGMRSSECDSTPAEYLKRLRVSHSAQAAFRCACLHGRYDGEGMLPIALRSHTAAHPSMAISTVNKSSAKARNSALVRRGSASLSAHLVEIEEEWLATPFPEDDEHEYDKQTESHDYSNDDPRHSSAVEAGCRGIDTRLCTLVIVVNSVEP